MRMLTYARKSVHPSRSRSHAAEPVPATAGGEKIAASAAGTRQAPPIRPRCRKAHDPVADSCARRSWWEPPATAVSEPLPGQMEVGMSENSFHNFEIGRRFQCSAGGFQMRHYDARPLDHDAPHPRRTQERPTAETC